MVFLHMKRIEYALLIGIIFAVALSGITGFAAECEELRGEVLRLHIIAGSDSDDDQRLKYLVRDCILAEGAELFEGADSTAARELAHEQLPRIEALARGVLRENGRSDDVSARLVNMYFGTRKYGDMLVAAGWYDALRITIGEGEGENWWCVMFPPMCLPAAAADSDELCGQLEELGQEKFIPRFAVLELAEQARNIFNPREEAALP